MFATLPYNPIFMHLPPWYEPQMPPTMRFVRRSHMAVKQVEMVLKG